MTCSAGSPTCGTLFDVATKEKQLAELTARMEAPDFWDVPERAQGVIAQTKPLNGMLRPFRDLEEAGTELRALAELCEEDDSLEPELEPALAALERQLGDFKMRSMLDGPQDASNAYLRIQAGTGGTEACDWAEMLLRMYARWAERHGYEAEIVDKLDNEEAGIRSATLHIAGDYAY